MGENRQVCSSKNKGKLCLGSFFKVVRGESLLKYIRKNTAIGFCLLRLKKKDVNHSVFNIVYPFIIVYQKKGTLLKIMVSLLDCKIQFK